MIERAIFLALGAGGLAAAIAPGLTALVVHGGEGAPPNPSAAPVTPLTDPGREDTWQGAARTLLRDADGHFYADGRVQGAKVRFLLDTGASVVALTAADARAAGIWWSAADVRPVARGAGGVVRGVPTRLAEVEVDGIRRANVAAVVIPEGLETSLLGQSWLSRVGNLEIAGDRLTLDPDPR